MFIGKHISEIETPALVIDIDKLKSNIRSMSDYLKQTNCSIRPHFQ
jgi:Predicted amino acid aldolase or racemase